MPHHRGGHAEPRIGVDIGGADESFHQFVGDVVILGQELTRDVKRDRIRAMFGNGVTEHRGDAVERLVPARRPAGRRRVQQAVGGGHRFGKRRSFRAQFAVIGRVIGIAGHRSIR